MTSDSPRQDYAFRDNAAWDALMRQRGAGLQAGFLRPFLRPGMSIIDIGCGQGTITAGLAEIVAPGTVLGFDPQEEHVRRAQAVALERGLNNLTFETGDIYKPPCPPESFDLAYANAVFTHLPDPHGALHAIKTILKPGGLIAVRDRGGRAVYTGSGADACHRLNTIFSQAIRAVSGGPPGVSMGEQMNRMCREAGYEIVSITGSWEITYASQWANAIANMVESIRKPAVEHGFSTEDELRDLVRVIQGEWAADPDAIWGNPWFEVVARRP